MIKKYSKYFAILIVAFVVGVILYLILPAPSFLFALKTETFTRDEPIKLIGNNQNKGKNCEPKTVYYFEENGYTQEGEGIANAYCAELQGKLASAIAGDNFDLVRNLLSAGVNVNSPNNNSDLAYPMVVAVKRGNVEMVKLLLDNDGDVNEADICCMSSESILMLAIENNNVEMVKLLLSRGADVNFKGFENQSVLEAAEKTENQEIKELIVNSCEESILCRIKFRTTKLINVFRGI